MSPCLDNTIHICMITNNNYVIPTMVAITSAIKNKLESSRYHFHLIVDKLSTFNLNTLKSMKTPSVIIETIPVDSEKYSSIQVKTHVPTSALLKFDIPNLIKTDKILYLDGDIIVNKDLSEFFQIDLKENIVAAVRDMGAELRFIKLPNYFNSGVMLLDLKKMRTENISEKLLHAKLSHPEWKCMDQDALNHVFHGRIHWLPVRYNAMLALYQNYKFSIQEINQFYQTSYENELELQADSIINHFAGIGCLRPWKVANGTFADIWDKYYNQSPFKNLSLNRSFYVPTPNTVTPKQMKKKKKYYLFGIPFIQITENS